ncbi:hypothetical protein GCM10027202_03750 [Microvirgula curvata]
MAVKKGERSGYGHADPDVPPHRVDSYGESHAVPGKVEAVRHHDPACRHNAGIKAVPEFASAARKRECGESAAFLSAILTAQRTVRKLGRHEPAEPA